MRKNLLILLVFLSLTVLTLRFGVNPVLNYLGYESQAGIKISSTPEAKVFIDGKEVGNTPYEGLDLKVGEYNVRLVKDKEAWEGRVRLTKGALTVVNRELGQTISSSSGEVLVLNSGSGAVLTSTPPEAEVEIDGNSYGKTPLSVSNLPPGEHTFLLSREGYLKRSIRALLPPNMSLNIDVDLAIPEITSGSIPTPTEVPAIKLVVKQTSTGFLRVRDKPSLGGKEVGRVLAGTVLTQLEAVGSWIKVQLEDGMEGYVSASYVVRE